ncbi:MAG TPA: metallophosphoesterase family protein [Stellaceae bacterium]|nr:metallophosphoesterase family protein [Stellaceae bacterium]
MLDSARIDTPPTPTIVTDQTVLLFGGCYSNLEATFALRAEARRLGIPPERTVCTGDVVAYCADAAETVALIRDWGVWVVMGNCEESLGYRKDDCGCGFAEETMCRRIATEWFAYADSEINEDQRNWMRSLPRRLEIRLAEGRLAVVHGSVDSINRFIFASTSWREKRRQVAMAGCDGVIAGHCGIPFAQAVGGELWLNAGAIGMPANDGTRHGWYSILIPKDRGIEIRLVPLDYDARSAATKMRLRGLPEGYASALDSGLWPSCDVLPAVERARQGDPLLPRSLLWNRIRFPPRA